MSTGPSIDLHCSSILVVCHFLEGFAILFSNFVYHMSLFGSCFLLFLVGQIKE